MHDDAPGSNLDGMTRRGPGTGSGPSLFFGAEGVRPVWCLLLYLAIILTPVLLLVVASRLARQGPAPVHSGGPVELHALPAMLMEVFQFGFVLFATWIMARIEDRDVFDFGLQWRRRSGRRLVYGAICGLLAMSLLIAILFGTHHLVFTGALLRPLPALGYGAIWAADFCVVALFEEFLFRGYLQSVLTRCFAGLFRRVAPGLRRPDAAGFWSAAVLISFGFGLVHQTNADESPIGLLCAGLAGLLFAFSLWRTGALWWAIGLHAAWDWAQSYLFGVADSGTVSAGRLLGSHPAGSVLLSGGSTGPEGSVFVLPVMLLIAVVIAMTLPRASGDAVDLPWSERPTLLPNELAEVNSPRA